MYCEVVRTKMFEAYLSGIGLSIREALAADLVKPTTQTTNLPFAWLPSLETLLMAFLRLT